VIVLAQPECPVTRKSAGHSCISPPAEDYARAILSARPDGNLSDLDEQVAARLARQKILSRTGAPQLWCILDEGVLHRAIELAAAGEPGFYGFAMARQLRDASAARQLTAHGTLYKALARLEQAGLLTSSWEDPGLAEAGRRPRRRLYRVTPSGEQAVLRSAGQRASTASRPGLGLAPA
jgi:PadR family transcriptional regulator PadR